MIHRVASAPRIFLIALVSLGLAPVASAAEPLVAEGTWFDGAAGSLLEMERRLGPVEGGWAAPNRAANLRTRWADGVVTQRPRLAAGAEHEWSLRFELKSHGRLGALVPVSEVGCESVDGHELRWGRGSLDEWYVNREHGVEQGFLLRERPVGDFAAPVALQGSFEGLFPVVDELGQRIALYHHDGEPVLTVEELIVFDATGEKLPAWLEAGDGEYRILFDDSDAVYPVTVDPVFGNPAWSYDPDDAGAHLGWSVCTAGDVNNDGFADLIVGAPDFDITGSSSAGAALVFHGGAGGPSLTPDWMVTGVETLDQLGLSVSTAGDVNGDGISDVIVGLPGHDTDTATDVGRAYVYFGSGSGLSVTPSWTVEGDVADGRIGFSVCYAGDTNGSGRGDVIIGAPDYPTVLVEGEDPVPVGAAFVFFGETVVLGVDSSTAMPDWSYIGDEENAAVGHAVCGLGNVNGDAWDDVALGAPYYDNGEVDEGVVKVFHGSGSGPRSDGDHDWLAEINRDASEFGYSLTGGDWNDDGFADIAVGGPTWRTNGGEERGRVLGWHGAAGGLNGGTDGRPNNAVFTRNGGTGHGIGSRFGHSVRSAGDTNCDGYEDLVVGIPLRDRDVGGFTRVDVGRARMYEGSGAGLIQAPVGWSETADESRGEFGFSVAGAGDVNGDGGDDILVGAARQEGLIGGQVDEGFAHLYYANIGGITADADSDGVLDCQDECDGGDDNFDADSDGVPDDCDQCDGCDDELNAPPQITCPGDTTIDCTDDTGPASTGMATATDDCQSDGLSIDWEDTIDDSDPCQTIIFRLWTAEDVCGNLSSCVQEILLVDSTPPDFECPPTDVTIECTASTDPADTGMPGNLDDDCGGASASHADVIVAGPCGNERTIMRTWTVTDDCGNAATCLQVIPQEDRFDPILTVPDDAVVQCGGSTDPADTGQATATDDCDDAPEVSYSDIASDGPCDGAFQIIQRTWLATDDCGNTTTGVQVVTETDDTPPEIDCPIDLEIECGDSTHPDDTFFATATDNCDDDVDISWSDATNGDPCSEVISRTWTATDDCGNTTTCVQTLTIVDEGAPEFTDCPDDTTIDCDQSTDPVATGQAEATDDCQDPNVTFTDTEDDDDPCDIFLIRLWTATDGCGNSTTCEQRIRRIDQTGPTLECPPDTTIGCADSTAPADTGGEPTVIGECGMTTATFSDSITENDCGRTIERTWTVTDNCNNSTTCVQMIMQLDTQDPSLMLPDDTTIECGDSTLPADTGTATATDDCSMVDVSWTDEVIGGPCDISNCCVPHGGQGCDDPGCEITVCAINTFCCDVTWDATCAGLADAVCGPVCDGPVGQQILRTWAATDGCGNSTTGVQTIEVIDETPPNIECPPNVTIECTDDTLPVNTGSPDVMDACSSATPLWMDAVDDSDPCNVVITRTWTATDECGNSASCEQLINITDSTGPVMDCPPDTTVECTDDTTPANTGMPTADDNCSEATFEWDDEIVDGGCEGEWTIERTWTAADACGNVSTCLQTILVVDTTAPDFVECPADDTIECTDSTDPADTGMPAAEDACDGVTMERLDQIFVGDCDGEYTLVRTWTATDDCGNASTCQQTIEVFDTTGPEFTLCPDDVSVECGDSTDPADTGMPTAQDGCSDIVMTREDVTEPGECEGSQVITRTWTATDDCGNATTCQQTIHVVDTEPPLIFDCPDGLVFLACSDSTDPSNTGGFAQAVDDCDGVTITFEDESMSTGFCSVNLVRTWIATDDCGNSSTCTQNIILTDEAPPSIDCPPDLTIECDDPDDPANTGEPSVEDDCADAVEVVHSDVIVPGECAREWTIRRTWTGTDACDNSTTCVQVINVVDTTDPEFTTPPDTEVGCDDSTDPDDTGIPLNVMDNCSTPNGVTIEHSDSTEPGDCDNEWTILRLWTATDECGNSSSGTQTITVVDETAPTFTVPADTTIECDESTDPENTGDVDDALDCPADGTTEVTFSDEVTPGSCPQEWTILRTWTVTDACDNSSSQEQTITVFDGTAPTFTVPPDMTIECDESTSPDDTGTPTERKDNCSDEADLTNEWSDFVTPGGCPNEWTITRTWWVVDECGNSQSSTQTITVEDTTAPSMMCPPTAMIACESSTDPVDTGEPTLISDNCSEPDDIDVSYSDSIPVDANCCDGYTITRTWTATDECDNARTCTQSIIVLPQPQLEIEKTAGVILPANTLVVSIENTAFASVGGNMAETTIETPNGCISIPYTITVTNMCDADATNVMVGDLLPVGAIPVAAMPPGVFDPPTRTYRWTLLSLLANTSEEFDLTIEICPCPAQEDCENGIDDTGDSLADCDDPTCFDDPACGD